MTKDERDALLRTSLNIRSMDESGITTDDPYCSWSSTDKDMCLDGDFTADQLEALASYMREFSAHKD